MIASHQTPSVAVAKNIATYLESGSAVERSAVTDTASKGFFDFCDAVDICGYLKEYMYDRYGETLENGVLVTTYCDKSEWWASYYSCLHKK
jgi:hypothetical protein